MLTCAKLAGFEAARRQELSSQARGPLVWKFGAIARAGKNSTDSAIRLADARPAPQLSGSLQPVHDRQLRAGRRPYALQSGGEAPLRAAHCCAVSRSSRPI